MSTTPLNQSRAAGLLTALGAYRPARQAFLTELGLPASNRDPLAEFSEQFVAALTAARLPPAGSRPDTTSSSSTTSRSRSATWPTLPVPGSTSTWCVRSRACTGTPSYYSRAFTVTGVLAFPARSLAPICQALGKRHPRQNENPPAHPTQLVDDP